MTNHLDHTLAAETRASLLLDEMTLREKAHQLTGVFAWDLIRPDGSDVEGMVDRLDCPPGHVAQLIREDPAQLSEMIRGIQTTLLTRTRLGIPALFHAEALNGLLAGGHMVFPTAIGLAATWRPDLIEVMADLMRRQLVRVGIRHALSPVMDVALDPRWGRVHETYGEDPYLVAAHSVAFTRGMQGDDLRNGVLATGKHFLGYAAPEAGLNAATIPAGARRLRDVFALPFEAAVRMADLQSVMNTYSDVDGVPMAASRELLTDFLRTTLGFEGFVSADYGSIEQLVTRQGVAQDAGEAGRLALTAGLDVEFPRPFAYGDRLVAEIEAGRLGVAALDESVHRVLTAKFRTGLFENPFPAESIDVRAVAVEGDDLSLDLARRSVVLLENDGVLPMAVAGKRIAVVGPHADAPQLQFAAYSYPSWRQAVDAIHFGGEITMVGVDNTADAWHEALLPQDLGSTLATEEYGTKSFAHAFAAAGAEVLTERGSGLTERLGDEAVTAAVRAVEDSEFAVVALGGASLWFSGERTEGEASDTADISLPAAQAELLDAVAATGVPFVIVLVQGRPYPLPVSAANARAVIVSTFGGPYGPTAVVDVLSGAFEPVGRLPYSIPRHTGQVPIYHHRLTGSGGQVATSDYPSATYLDMPTSPAYPFGHGLGFTTFSASDLIVPSTVDTRGQLPVTVRIENTGTRVGSTVAQLYLRVRSSGIIRPAQQLAGFQHVTLSAGESARVEFVVDMTQLAASGVDRQLAVEPGMIDVVVGFDASGVGPTQRVVVDGVRHVVDPGSRVFFARSGIVERVSADSVTAVEEVGHVG